MKIKFWLIARLQQWADWCLLGIMLLSDYLTLPSAIFILSSVSFRKSTFGRLNRSNTPPCGGSVPVILSKSSLVYVVWLVEFSMCDLLGVFPNGRAVDADLYSQQLDRVYEILRRIYPAFFNRDRILLQQNIARTPHTTGTIKTKMQELGWFELLPHPAYNPDLAPSDYHLFQSMIHSLRGRNFESIEAVEVSHTEFFAPKTRDWYRRGIINLSERWL